MKRKTLLLVVMASFITASYSQKKQQPITGYAITAIEKGGRSWKEVRFVNINSGEEVKSIYQSTQEVPVLNARTGQPVVKKDLNAENTVSKITVRKVVNLDQELERAQGSPVPVRKVIHISTKIQTDKPFATNSAACAYDKKHERLYYTPMGINQLRYIDMKAKTPAIYYFEDEPFGTVKGMHDAANQITRMVIASDGNGYALTNDGNHLVRFTTGKKPTITDLGALADDGANGKFSVHSSGGYGGDMIADASGNLYLLTANRNVFKISIETKIATWLGVIKGLPKGFSTNGAMVEEGSKIIVASSESTVGYYRVDLTSLQAEKVSQSGNVFNASDLANGNLAFAKKKKDKKDKEVAEPIIVKEEVKEVDEEIAAKPVPGEVLYNNGITVYPNPVTNGFFRLSFADQPAGKYQVQVVDMSGKLISAREVSVANKIQVEEFRLPELLAGGNYLVKVINEPNKISVSHKLVVQ